MSGRYVLASDGVRLAYREDGSRSSATLLLCSMGTAALSVWDLIVPELSQRWHIIRYDRRGDGDSDPGTPESHNLQTYTQDALSMLDACHCPKAVICGMAFGARVAYHVALAAPDRSRALMLFDATGGPPAPEMLRKEGRHKAAAARRSAGLSDIAVDGKWFERRDSKGAGLVRHALAGIPAWVPGLEAICVPALVACGEFDPNLPGAQRLAREIPGAEFVVMPMTGHASILDRPSLVQNLIIDFMENL